MVVIRIINVKLGLIIPTQLINLVGGVINPNLPLEGIVNQHNSEAQIVEMNNGLGRISTSHLFFGHGGGEILNGFFIG